MPQPMPIAVISCVAAANAGMPVTAADCHLMSTRRKANAVMTAMINRMTGMV